MSAMRIYGKFNGADCDMDLPVGEIKGFHYNVGGRTTAHMTQGRSVGIEAPLKDVLEKFRAAVSQETLCATPVVVEIHTPVKGGIVKTKSRSNAAFIVR